MKFCEFEHHGKTAFLKYCAKGFAAQLRFRHRFLQAGGNRTYRRLLQVGISHAPAIGRYPWPILKSISHRFQIASLISWKATLRLRRSFYILKNAAYDDAPFSRAKAIRWEAKTKRTRPHQAASPF